MARLSTWEVYRHEAVFFDARCRSRFFVVLEDRVALKD